MCESDAERSGAIPEPKVVEVEIGGKKLAIETGEMAKQSDGATLLRYGDTVVLSTVVASKRERPDVDFFPLTIDYREKASAAGKIPGGFFKREGRPTEKEVLTSRLIDRPVRPMFPDGFKSETQGIVSVLSYGYENIADILGVVGISTSLMLSDIPFNGPVSAVRVGMVDGELISCPAIESDLEETEDMELEFIVAGTDDAVVMVEGRGSEVSEDLVLKAIDFAHEEIKRINAAQREIAEICGKPKRAFSSVEVDEAFKAEITSFAQERMKECIAIPGKMQRQEAINLLSEEVVDKFNTEEEDRSKEISEILHDLEKDLVRRTIVEDGIRSDGRRLDEIRDIYGKVGLLPRAHGSALFVRGETQSIVTVTLGTSQDEQRIDALEGESFKSFMLHYNFPPFSVGEVRRFLSPGRREIGHGALAERAIRAVMPSKEDFPYTVRIVSDILESNGSSSMATVCGGTLALMDAGVPIESPVAGIAMGLVQENGKSAILSDILGLEDHLGDMDFKVTGSEKGITAFQMDVKISGISREVMEKALDQAKAGRLHIMKKMSEALATPRADIASHAPRIYSMQVKPQKVREVIGAGGKVIRGIVEQTGVKIDIDDSGLVNIISLDEESANMAIKIIEGIIEDAEVGKTYQGRVVKIVDFGAFVEILPGTEGLLHISQIDEKRTEKVSDVLSEGDVVPVKVLEINDQGKIRLSRKAALREG